MSEQREQWQSTAGFIMAAVGSAVGLGNIWRFSYVTYENGGGAFLVPYLLALFIVGIPLLLLEFGIGHYMKASAPLSMFRIDRRFQWVGWWSVAFTMFGISPGPIWAAAPTPSFSGSSWGPRRRTVTSTGPLSLPGLS
ncbi:MAG: hypothetical protein ABEK42_06900 [Thiohalorhabdaceae bacterium]